MGLRSWVRRTIFFKIINIIVVPFSFPSSLTLRNIPKAWCCHHYDIRTEVKQFSPGLIRPGNLFSVSGCDLGAFLKPYSVFHRGEASIWSVCHKDQIRPAQCCSDCCSFGSMVDFSTRPLELSLITHWALGHLSNHIFLPKLLSSTRQPALETALVVLNFFHFSLYRQVFNFPNVQPSVLSH